MTVFSLDEVSSDERSADLSVKSADEGKALAS
jgi:hypothetical protein